MAGLYLMAIVSMTKDEKEMILVTVASMTKDEKGMILNDCSISD